MGASGNDSAVRICTKPAMRLSITMKAMASAIKTHARQLGCDSRVKIDRMILSSTKLL